METKNEYSIKISGINSDWSHYSVWKNEQDIDSYDLTIEDCEFLQKELLYYSEMFRKYIKYLEELKTRKQSDDDY